ncbi:RES family NAD+ phosphorylase [Rhodococcus sp. NPDC019627]|uniref:RES family NAD+ phosphorylase n=1 Tax=unclassified Rhodococcus (in: high G+C Gram-positive bacteria) TaxID=192944 RepID=UPI0033F2CDEA
MPAAPPPPDLAEKPVVVFLPRGTELWRIHTGTYAANAVNPTAQPTVPGGARFDSLTGDYAYTYLGDSPEAAVAETLCRDLAVTGSPRLVPRARIAGRVLSRLTVTTDVTVIALHGPHLSAVGQDTWLTKSDPSDYLYTRTWARALFDAAPSADGLVYRCRHNEDQFAWMLTTDPANPTHPALDVSGTSVNLDSPAGLALVEGILACYNATLASTI